MAAAGPAQASSRPGGGSLGDSNASSPLSEVDDGDPNDDEMERIQLHPTGPVEPKPSLSGHSNNALESDSALSDAASDVHYDPNDTEAETERLYDTPTSQRQRDALVDHFSNGPAFEPSPSKLNRATPAVGDASLSGDDASAASSQVISSDALVAKSGTKVDELVTLDSQERKRKRSPLADQSGSDEPLRKRTGSVAALETTAQQDIVANEDDNASANPLSGQQSVAEDEPSSSSNRETTSEAPERETKTTKSTRSSSKRKALPPEDAPAAAAAEADSDTREALAPEDEAEQPEEAVDADVDEEMDAAVKNIEEMQRKHAAFRDWTHIEDMFNIFRERLYKDRLQRLEEEERSLLADEPTHPEYLNMKKCIDDRLEKRLQEIDAEHELRMRAHERRAVAQRAQIWSQFFQAVREKRDQAVERLNQQWYEVQSARRSTHSLPEYGLFFPKEPAQRLRNAVAYNTEVSTLAGLAKHVGFPAVPELKGASATELESDLNAIEHVRRGRQRHGRDEYQAPTFSRLGPAGEQFLKDTPWANPNHSAHKLSLAPSDCPQRRAAPTANGPPAAEAEAKAASEGQPVVRRSPALTDSPEMARNVLSHAAHPMKRVSSIPNLTRGTKTATA
ncbi:Sds3-like protein [Ophiocordyceps camponoti-floridani]|uniref:Sds3-like protein n=1 Tax=Ophiocordyceps camponoti-floridani TaxID=2030778 RepID=A0A8H4VG17_9HYPO|nr:Sds3-like protein [Ophiocordyceps camponoti-floridani]